MLSGVESCGKIKQKQAIEKQNNTNQTLQTKTVRNQLQTNLKSGSEKNVSTAQGHTATSTLNEMTEKNKK